MRTGSLRALRASSAATTSGSITVPPRATWRTASTNASALLGAGIGCYAAVGGPIIAYLGGYPTLYALAGGSSLLAALFGYRIKALR